MSTNQPNPYAAPQSYSTDAAQPNIDQATLNKATAIIKDADQFWLAILMCIVCTGWGMLVVGPWYLVRLLQWNSVAQQYPVLLDPNTPHGSISQKFQSAKTKLIIGMAVGGAMLLMVVSVLVVLSIVG